MRYTDRVRLNHLLYLTTFVANAAILVFEIAGARLLAPYLGTSVEVWSGTIAVILGGMALGYYLGGKAADKHPTRHALGMVVFAAGIAALIAWSLRDLIPSYFMGAHGAPLTFVAMYVATFLFAPTVILLAAVSPFVAKFLLTTLDASAQTIGAINSIGTLGSIAGAILSGVFLIPYFGLSNIFLGIAVALLCLSFLLSTGTFSRRSALMGFIVLLASGIEVSVNANLPGATRIADVTTPYNRIWVFEGAYKGEAIRALQTDPFGIQCGMYVTEGGGLDEERLAFTYTRAFDAFAHTEFDNKTPRALFLGGCNYSYPRAFLHRFKEATATVVEIDPGMTEIAKQYFEFIPAHFPTLTIVHQDARQFLNESASTYDLVFMDVFGSFSNTPPHLTTKESFESLAKNMAPEGLLVMNVIAARTGAASKLAASLVKTLETAFEHVAIYAINEATPAQAQNLIIAASNQRPLPEKFDRKKFDITLTRFDAQVLKPGIVLTDNYAPAEYMTASLRARI